MSGKGEKEYERPTYARGSHACVVPSSRSIYTPRSFFLLDSSSALLFPLSRSRRWCVRALVAVFFLSLPASLVSPARGLSLVRPCFGAACGHWLRHGPPGAPPFRISICLVLPVPPPFDDARGTHAHMQAEGTPSISFPAPRSRNNANS